MGIPMIPITTKNVIVMGSSRRRLALLLVMMTSLAMVEPIVFYAKIPKITSESFLREEIQELIDNSPGTYFRSTIRSMNRTVGVIEYHLNWLIDNGQLVSFETNNYKGYFPAALSRLPDRKKRGIDNDSSSSKTRKSWSY